MIPSRPLPLVEIISETFSIFGRTFLRYALLFLLLLVPGLCLVTAGGTTLVGDSILAARHEMAFDDSDLTALRNDFNAALASQNPAFAATLHVTGEPYPHPRTRQLYYFVRANLTRFSSSLGLLATGLVLFIIGLFALAAATVDLASQAFEERELEFFGSLGAAFARHVWKMLLLYMVYLIAVWGLDAILVFLPGTAGDAMSGFVLVAQIYLMFRLMVTVPVLVSEELGPFQSLARSWQLTRNAGWRTLGASFVFGVIFFVGLLMLSVVLQLVFSGVPIWWNDFLTRDRLTILWFLTTLPGFIRAAAAEISFTLLIFFGLLPVFGTVLYYDLRTRHDGPLVYLDENV